MISALQLPRPGLRAVTVACVSAHVEPVPAHGGEFSLAYGVSFSVRTPSPYTHQATARIVAYGLPMRGPLSTTVDLGLEPARMLGAYRFAAAWRVVRGLRWLVPDDALAELCASACNEALTRAERRAQ